MEVSATFLTLADKSDIPVWMFGIFLASTLLSVCGFFVTFKGSMRGLLLVAAGVGLGILSVVSIMAFEASDLRQRQVAALEDGSQLGYQRVEIRDGDIPTFIASSDGQYVSGCLFQVDDMHVLVTSKEGCETPGSNY